MEVRKSLRPSGLPLFRNRRIVVRCSGDVEISLFFVVPLGIVANVLQRAARTNLSPDKRVLEIRDLHPEDELRRPHRLRRTFESGTTP